MEGQNSNYDNAYGQPTNGNQSPEANQIPAANPEPTAGQLSAAEPTQPASSEPAANAEPVTIQSPVANQAPAGGPNPYTNQNPYDNQGFAANQNPSFNQNAYAPAPAILENQPSPTGALVCGILSIILCFLPLVSIILGIVAIVLAGKYFKNGGTAGTGKAGRICGIVGIVLAFLTIVITTALVIFGLAVMDEYDSRYGSYSSSRYSMSSSSSDVDLNADEEAITQLINGRLEAIKAGDPQAIASIADMLRTEMMFMDDEFSDDASLIDALDFEQFIKIMATPFDYTDDSSSIEVYGTRTGRATYWITMKDSIDFTYRFDELVEDYNDNLDVSSMTLEQFYEDYNAMFLQAAQEAATNKNALLMIDLTRNSDGSWKIDEDSWTEEITYLFL